MRVAALGTRNSRPHRSEALRLIDLLHRDRSDVHVHQIAEYYGFSGLTLHWFSLSEEFGEVVLEVLVRSLGLLVR